MKNTETQSTRTAGETVKTAKNGTFMTIWDRNGNLATVFIPNK